MIDFTDTEKDLLEEALNEQLQTWDAALDRKDITPEYYREQTEPINVVLDKIEASR